MEQNTINQHPQQHSGLGIAGMVIGIISVLLACIAIGGFTGAIGLILSLIGITQKNRKTGMAVAGITLNIVALLIFAFMFFAVSGDDNEDKSTISKIEETVAAESESIETSTTEDTKSEEKITASVGEYVQGDTWKISLLEAKQYDSIPDEYFSDVPEIDGNKYLVLFFEIENVSSKDDYFNVYYMESYLDGYSIEQTYLINDPENYEMLGGNVSSGKKAKGYVAFEVNPDWEEFEFSYKEWVGPSEKLATFVITSDQIN